MAGSLEINIAVPSSGAQIADASGRSTPEFYRLMSEFARQIKATGGSIPDLATVAQYRALSSGVAEMSVVADALEEVTLTDAATIAWDASAGVDFKVTLGGNRTLGAMSNTATCIGKRGRLRVIQDGTGSRTLAKHSSYKMAYGMTAPTLSTAANAVDVFTYDIVADGVVYLYPAGTAFA